MRPLAPLLASALALAATACTVRIDEGQVFRPPETSPQARAPLALVGEEALADEFGAEVAHSVQRFGGEDIAVTLVTAPGGDGSPRPLILSCSGNASDRPSSGVSYAAKLLPHGDAVLFDYPGYGDSSGTASVEAIERVRPDLMAWVRERAGDRPLVLWGHSLGGFVCAEFARESGADAVVLETTARNVVEVGRAWRPWWAPVRLRPTPGLARFDTAAALAEFGGPVLILGAGRDRVLPVGLHRSLAEALPDAQYLEMAEATHYSAGFDPRAVEAVSRLVAQLD